MNQTVYNKRRKLLEDSITSQLQEQFGIHSTGKVEEELTLGHLSEEDIPYRRNIFDHFKALGRKARESTSKLHGRKGPRRDPRP